MNELDRITNYDNYKSDILEELTKWENFISGIEEHSQIVSAFFDKIKDYKYDENDIYSLFNFIVDWIKKGKVNSFDLGCILKDLLQKWNKYPLEINDFLLNPEVLFNLEKEHIEWVIKILLAKNGWSFLAEEFLNKDIIKEKLWILGSIKIKSAIILDAVSSNMLWSYSIH